MYLWIENSIRGGICFVGKRYALANNPFIHGFNKHEEDSYIIAVDANNLYGYAMSQPLPIGHFFWLTKDEIVQSFCTNSQCMQRCYANPAMASYGCSNECRCNTLSGQKHPDTQCY
ncbi:uncharacterized protein TNCV_130051 [Trichonephila clavipes]|nr:uncharacterized protein TNCV_130051 [Trichonephila clavipes]